MSRQQQALDTEAEDDLFGARSAFYTGNYQQAINEAMALTGRALGEEAESERSALVVRAHLALGNAAHARLTLQQQPALPHRRPLLLLLDHMQLEPESAASSGADHLAQLDQMAAGNGNEGERIMAALVAAIVRVTSGEHEAALRSLHAVCGAGVGAGAGEGAGASWAAWRAECRALQVHALAAMARGDLALKAARELPDDTPLHQLALAWAHLATGCSGVQEAHYAALEVCEAGGGGGAGGAAAGGAAGVGAAARALWPEAEAALLQALAAHHAHPALLHDLAVVSRHARKPTHVAEGYWAQAGGPSARHRQDKAAEFRRLAAQYRPQVL